MGCWSRENRPVCSAHIHRDTSVLQYGNHIMVRQGTSWYIKVSVRLSLYPTQIGRLCSIHNSGNHNMVYYDVIFGLTTIKRVINHNMRCQGYDSLSLFCYPQTGEKYKHKWTGVSIFFQCPEDCRPIIRRQYSPCLGTGVILKYIDIAIKSEEALL